MSQSLIDDKSTLVQVGARRQPINWTNVNPDICHHMALLGHIDFIGINREVFG